jgi:hypothetical protein
MPCMPDTAGNCYVASGFNDIHCHTMQLRCSTQVQHCSLHGCLLAGCGAEVHMSPAGTLHAHSNSGASQ